MSYNIHNILSFYEQNNQNQPNITTMAYKNNKLYLSCYQPNATSTVGLIYILNADNSTTQLYRFPETSNINGVMPIGQIYISSDGNTLYGITKFGGTDNKGTFYKISGLNSTPQTTPTFISIPNGTAVNPVGLLFDDIENSFYIACTNGYIKVNSPSFDSIFINIELTGTVGITNSFILKGSLLYGTQNSTDKGSVFSVNTTNNNSVQTIYNFTNTSSGQTNPNQIILSTDKNIIYGTTYYGGNTNYGTLYSITITGSIYNLIYSFTSLYFNPIGTLIQIDNLLYGVTYNSSGSNYGVLFNCNIIQSTVENIYGFSEDSYSPTNLQINADTLYIPTYNPLSIAGDVIGTIGIYTITPVCFNQNARILCLNDKLIEEYISIKKIKKGTLVKTYKHGFRRVDLIGKKIMRNDPSSLFNCMYRLKSTDPEMPDLIVTGLHGICEDNISENEHEKFKEYGIEITKIDDKYLVQACISNKFEKIKNRNIYTYYHLTLEHEGNENAQYAIMANGVLTETTCENNFKRTGFTLTN